MKFSDLLLEQISFEVRYEPRFLYWDNCGKVLTGVAEKYPQLQIRDVSVTMTTCDLWDEGLSLLFDHSRAAVTHSYPDKLGVMEEFAGHAVDVIKKHFDVQTFSRVGCRFVYSFPTKSRDAAQDLLAGSSLVAMQADRFKPFGSRPTEVMVRFEDDSKGYMLRLSGETRESKIRVPRPLTIKTANVPKDGLLFDLDSYTKKLVGAMDLNIADFVKSVGRNIRENLFNSFGF